MSVYTKVDARQLQSLLADYAVGELERFEGISAGITNTNYFVDTSLGRWVLTLFERTAADELPYFLDLMDHLAKLGVPSAHPVARRDGGFLSRVADKPAALVYRLRGHSVHQPSGAQCAAMGAAVAEMHRAGIRFSGQRPNSRNLAWCAATRDLLAPQLDGADLQLLDDELAWLGGRKLDDLPRGVIHADLFRDNVLFAGDHVSGLIDFYYACNDCLLFDLAVICNDWCRSRNNRFLASRWEALSAAYARRRPYTRAEHKAWPAVLRVAALRFWVSRLHDWHFPRDGEVTHQKDPAPLARLLTAHHNGPPPLLP
ncbi:MAG: homoserine kinase [Salinisphaera sp.]|nr:homoserine kinase [Salinisphaera sp.]